MVSIVAVGCNVDAALIRSQDVSLTRCSLSEFEQFPSDQIEFLIWNNTYVMSENAVCRLSNLRTLFNWGTDNSNLPPEEFFLKRGISVYNNDGYCTDNVASFSYQWLGSRVGKGVVGIIGLGKIGYTIARKLSAEGVQVLYSARHAKSPSLPFQFCELPELIALADHIIIAVKLGTGNANSSILSEEILRILQTKERETHILNLSKERVFPVNELESLINANRVFLLSDNKPISECHENLRKCYSDHVAYKSGDVQSAVAIKHWQLQRAINNHLHIEAPVFVMRHGRTEWNDLGIFQGRLNSPLLPGVGQQMREVAGLLRNKEIKRIYCNSLGRCFGSAKIVADILNVPLEIVPNFLEMDFGSLNGQPKTMVDAYPDFIKNKELDIVYTPYPGGESYYDVGLRIGRDVDRILANGEPCLIVGHESVNRMIRGHILGWDNAYSARQRQAHGVVIRCQSGREEVVTE